MVSAVVVGHWKATATQNEGRGKYNERDPEGGGTLEARERFGTGSGGCWPSVRTGLLPFRETLPQTRGRPVRDRVSQGPSRPGRPRDRVLPNEVEVAMTRARAGSGSYNAGPVSPCALPL